MSSDDAHTTADITREYAEILPELARTASATAHLMSRWPAGDEHEYHRAFRGFTAFTRTQLKQHAELMELISVCYRDQGGLLNRGSSSSTNNNAAVDAADPAATASATTTNPIEAVDALFENVDHLLDSVRGVRVDATKQEEIRIGVSSTSDVLGGGGNKNKNMQQQVASTTAAGSRTTTSSFSRPQDSFNVPPDNFAEHFRHFVATTAETPSSSHQQQHKKSSQKKDDQQHNQGIKMPQHPHRRYLDDEKQQQQQSGQGQAHPLGDIITSFHWKPEHQAPPAKGETVFLDLATTHCTFIDTPAALSKLATTLQKEAEIAVDVEHHSEYSYLGFTCLIQISTRTADFIVDPLALRDEMWRLAPVFHDPGIVKVLHSATEDVRWLQRDFGLFIVNLFDTAIALQTLRMPHSLAFLVDHLCQVKLNKQHQNADWRLRPLSDSMLKYAQQDTHYLLYCYDRLRTMLASAETRASVGNLLLYVLQESKRLAASLYRKPPFDEATTWRETLGRSVAGLYPHQLQSIQGLFNWREKRARTVDTSPHAILSNGQLLSIGCRLPSTAAEVLRMANPATVEVRRSVREILAILDEARSKVVPSSSSSSSGKQKGTMSGGGDGKDSAADRQLQQSNMQQHNKNTNSADHQTERVHCPMTGTLPSVMDRQHQQSNNNNNDASTATAMSKAATTTSSLSSSSSCSLPPWMNCFHVLPSIDLASRVEVPMPLSLPQRRGRSQELEEEEEQGNSSAAAADDAAQTATEEQEVLDNDDDEFAPVKQDEQVSSPSGSKKHKDDAATDAAPPKSLAESYKGLGRAHRKKGNASARL